MPFPNLVRFVPTLVYHRLLANISHFHSWPQISTPATRNPGCSRVAILVFICAARHVIMSLGCKSCRAAGVEIRSELFL